MAIQKFPETLQQIAGVRVIRTAGGVDDNLTKLTQENLSFDRALNEHTTPVTLIGFAVGVIES